MPATPAPASHRPRRQPQSARIAAPAQRRPIIETMSRAARSFTSPMKHQCRAVFPFPAARPRPADQIASPNGSRCRRQTRSRLRKTRSPRAVPPIARSRLHWIADTQYLLCSSQRRVEHPMELCRTKRRARAGRAHWTPRLADCTRDIPSQPASAASFRARRPGEGRCGVLRRLDTGAVVVQKISSRVHLFCPRASARFINPWPRACRVRPRTACVPSPGQRAPLLPSTGSALHHGKTAVTTPIFHSAKAPAAWQGCSRAGHLPQRSLQEQKLARGGRDVAAPYSHISPILACGCSRRASRPRVSAIAS